MVTEGDLTRGGEHTVQCIGDVLWTCACETCVMLLTSVTPIHLLKRKKKVAHSHSVAHQLGVESGLYAGGLCSFPVGLSRAA